MLSFDYLMKTLPVLEEFSDNSKIERQILSAEGYDGVMAILDNIRTVEFPCVILEDRSLGHITFDSGFLDSSSCSIWVMVQDDCVTGSSLLYKKAFSLGISILKLFVRDSTSELSDIDYSTITYSKRERTDCYGYEFVITFREDIDMSI